MPNTLYLPELREMLASGDSAGLEDFCTALHPGRTADFMEALTVDEAWQVLTYADRPTQVEVFSYLERETQVEMITTLDRAEMASFIGDLPPDDRVDILKLVEPAVVGELLPLVPTEERRDILRLTSYPESTAGAVMTTEFAGLSEHLTVKQALEEVARQAEELETIYYLYIVDEEDHLRGLVSARDLVSAMGKPDTQIGDLMERDLVSVLVTDDQEEVARKVARYDIVAIPVVDHEHRLLGIITYDDVIDVMREEAMEDVHRIGAVDPLDVGYLETSLLTLTWKRGIWLTILVLAALLTTYALRSYETELEKFVWLVLFIPLVISSGGNSGSQSATLIISALAAGDITLGDWFAVIKRELVLGLLLGGIVALIAYVAAWGIIGDPAAAAVIPLTVILVVLCGTLCGAMFPLLFYRLGLDPALMSTPLVAAMIDLVGIVIYMNVAIILL